MPSAAIILQNIDPVPVPPVPPSTKTQTVQAFGGAPWREEYNDLAYEYVDAVGQRVQTRNYAEAERGQAAHAARLAGAVVAAPSIVAVVSSPSVKVEVTVPHIRVTLSRRGTLDGDDN